MLILFYSVCRSELYQVKIVTSQLLFLFSVRVLSRMRYDHRSYRLRNRYGVYKICGYDVAELFGQLIELALIWVIGRVDERSSKSMNLELLRKFFSYRVQEHYSCCMRLC